MPPMTTHQMKELLRSKHVDVDNMDREALEAKCKELNIDVRHVPDAVSPKKIPMERKLTYEKKAQGSPAPMTGSSKNDSPALVLAMGLGVCLLGGLMAFAYVTNSEAVLALVESGLQLRNQMYDAFLSALTALQSPLPSSAPQGSSSARTALQSPPQAGAGGIFEGALSSLQEANTLLRTGAVVSAIRTVLVKGPVGAATLLLVGVSAFWFANE